MTRLVSLLLVLCACGDNVIPDDRRACLVGRDCPDAGVDACAYAADAAPGDCCALLPDYAAATECAAAGTPQGACGELACEQPDCSFLQVPFCGKK